MTLSLRQSPAEAHICRIPVLAWQSLYLPGKVIMDYQKVGRGGAGNYYSQQDIEAVVNRATKDVEAQGSVPVASAEDIIRAQSSLASSGRGGAGNYASTTKLAATTAENTSITPALQETIPPEVGGYRGRGGAGNYKSEELGKKKQDEQRVAMAQERVHQQVVKDVEAGLQEPQKAHLGNEKLAYGI